MGQVKICYPRIFEELGGLIIVQRNILEMPMVEKIMKEKGIQYLEILTLAGSIHLEITKEVILYKYQTLHRSHNLIHHSTP